MGWYISVKLRDRIQRSWCGAKSAATWRSLAVTGNVAVATWALCARMIIAAGDGDEKKAPDNSASGSGRAGDRRGLAGCENSCACLTAGKK